MDNAYSRQQLHKKLRDEVAAGKIVGVDKSNTQDDVINSLNENYIQPLKIYKNEKISYELVQLDNKFFDLKNTMVTMNSIVDELRSSIKRVDSDSLISTQLDFINNYKYLNKNLKNQSSFINLFHALNKNELNQNELSLVNLTRKMTEINLVLQNHIQAKKYSRYLVTIINDAKHLESSFQELINDNSVKINSNLVENFRSSKLFYEENIKKISNKVLFFYKTWILVFTPFILVNCWVFFRYGWNLGNRNYAK